MEQEEKKERRSSILKPQHLPIADSGEVSASVTNAVKRRVSFHNVRTVQEFDVERSSIIHSPHNEPIKLHDTGSSDGLSSGQMSISDVDSKEFNGMMANFNSVRDPVLLPLNSKIRDISCDESTLRGKHIYTGNERDIVGQSGNVTGRQKSVGTLGRLSQDAMQDENLDVEPMDISNSSDNAALTTDTRKLLFRRSAVMKPFIIVPNQQSSVVDETLFVTQRIFKTPEEDKFGSDDAIEVQGTGVNTHSMNEVSADVYSMEITSNSTSDDEQISKEISESPPTQHLVADKTTDNNDNAHIVNEAYVKSELARFSNTVEIHGKALNHGEISKSLIMVDSAQDCDLSSNAELVPVQHILINDQSSTKSEGKVDTIIHPTDDTAIDLSLQLCCQHIGDDFSSSRKKVIESPVALPKKKIRLITPKVILPTAGSALQSELPADKRILENTSENTSSTDRSTDKVLNEIKRRLRHSLNQSGVFTLTELTDIDAEHAPMLYDIPKPEALLHTNDLSTQVSTVETLSDHETDVEHLGAESSLLLSRCNELVTAALGSESSFLTNRVDSLGFDINFRTVPCLRIKPNEQPQIVELKQLATTNLRRRLAQVVERCKSIIDAQLPTCNNQEIAECIKTLNPRKLSKKDASWFDACYLMAQREWFMLRAALATLTSEKLDELLLETKAEYERKRKLALSMENFHLNRDETMQRHAKLKLLDEAATNKAQNEIKYEQLWQIVRVKRLDVARKELEVMKKKGLRIKARLKEYERTTFEMEARAIKRAKRRTEFLQKYDEEIEAYQDIISDL